MDLSKSGFLKQVSLYLLNSNYQEAYDFCKENIIKYPVESAAHYMFSKAAFELGKYEESAKEAHIAFNTTSNSNEMILCALLAASSYYFLGQFNRAISVLESLKVLKQDENVEQLLAINYLAINEEAKAMEHFEKLLVLNRKMGENLLVRFLEKD